MFSPMIGPLEAVLFAAGSNGLSTEEMIHILQLPAEEVLGLCEELKTAFVEQASGLTLVEFGGTWQLVTNIQHAHYIKRMATAPTSGTLSTAALETLAIVAYKQHITRSGIEAIRGVHSERAVHTLVHRQLICDMGRDNSPGRPILYGTTEQFLQTFGLRSLDDLPPLPPQPVEQTQDMSLFQVTPLLARD